MATTPEQKWAIATGAFTNFITINPLPSSAWLLSIVDPSVARKTQFLTFVKDTYCGRLPHAIFSLESYTSNFSNLFSSIIESPSIRCLVPGGKYSNYQSETANALVDLSKKPLSVASNDIYAYSSGAVSDSTVTQSSNLSGDPGEIAESIQHFSELYSEIRISEIWLTAIQSIALPRNCPLLFLFDDFEAFDGQANSELRKLFWNTMIRAHGLMSGLRVVVGSSKELRIPMGWKNWGGATAVYL